MIHSLDLPIKKRNILRAYVENNANSLSKDDNSLCTIQNGRLTPSNFPIDYTVKKRSLEENKHVKKSDFFSPPKKLKVKNDAEKNRCQSSTSDVKSEDESSSELYIEAEFLVPKCQKPKETEVEIVSPDRRIEGAAKAMKPTQKESKATQKCPSDDEISVIGSQLRRSRAYFKSLTQRLNGNIEPQMPFCDAPFEGCGGQCEFCEELREVMESEEPQPPHRSPPPPLSLFDAHRLLMQKRERFALLRDRRSSSSTLSCSDASCLGEEAPDCCLAEETSCPYSSRKTPYLTPTPPSPHRECSGQRSPDSCNETTAKVTDDFRKMSRLIEESSIINIPPNIPELIPISSEGQDDSSENIPVREDVTHQENKKNSKAKKTKTRQSPVVCQSEYKEIKYVKKTPTIETDHTYYRSNGVLEIWIDRRKITEVTLK